MMPRTGTLTSLSDNIKKVVMDYYRKKTLLKDNPSMEYEYNKSKNSLNSTFGCFVQRVDLLCATVELEISHLPKNACNNAYAGKT